MPEFTLEEPSDDDAFRIWASAQPQSGNHLGLEGATVKLGPKVCKTVSLALFGDGTTGEVSKRVLRVSAFNRSDGQFDFSNPSATWFVENEEIDRLLAFLSHDVEQPGRYRVIDADSPIADLASILEGRTEDLQGLIGVLTENAEPDLIADALAQSATGLSGAEMAVIAERRRLVEQAVELAEQPTVTEPELQALIGDAWWLFGGRYVGVLGRRDLLNLDQHDIPLITADGSLHIVELKGPRVPSLIKKHRNHWIVGTDVHEATMQATNYVRSADEHALALQTSASEELGMEVALRRVFATVVVGHRTHLDAPQMPPEQFDLAIRTYNASLSRVQVVTYDQLFDAARRSLQFDNV
ncbi:MAG: DUF4263 domain-containing protein [bacterium]|nr:DUF4263 domain-containing protein [bacterium]